MKTRNLYLGLGLLLSVITSCKKEVPDNFSAKDGIYFNNRLKNNTLTDSTNITFVYMEANETTVHVALQALGHQSATARTISIKVTSEDATEGVDYILPPKAELPANSSSFNYSIILKRTPALQSKEKTIFLEIFENESFNLPITDELISGQKRVSTLKYKIVFSDMFSSPPAAWNDEGICGVFSPQKFNMICRVLEIPAADFNDPNKVTWAKFAYINQEMRAYVETNLNYFFMGMDFDPDIFDENGELLEF